MGTFQVCAHLRLSKSAKFLKYAQEFSKEKLTLKCRNTQKFRAWMKGFLRFRTSLCLVNRNIVLIKRQKFLVDIIEKEENLIVPKM